MTYLDLIGCFPHNHGDPAFRPHIKTRPSPYGLSLYDHCHNNSSTYRKKVLATWWWKWGINNRPLSITGAPSSAYR
jgi:hypothetical protein